MELRGWKKLKHCLRTVTKCNPVGNESFNIMINGRTKSSQMIQINELLSFVSTTLSEETYELISPRKTKFPSRKNLGNFILLIMQFGEMSYRQEVACKLCKPKHPLPSQQALGLGNWICLHNGSNQLQKEDTYKVSPHSHRSHQVLPSFTIMPRFCWIKVYFYQCYTIAIKWPMQPFPVQAQLVIEDFYSTQFSRLSHSLFCSYQAKDICILPHYSTNMQEDGQLNRSEG